MRSRAKLALIAALIVPSLLAVACSEKSSPTNPAPTQINVTGRWGTDITVQGISTRMTWTLTQTGTAVTGPVLVGLSNGVILLNGFLTGTMAGPSLTYTITVGPGGVPNQPACTGQLGGTMTVTISTVSTMVGPMSLLTSNCSLQLPSATMTLTKQ
jgi:hypothetical protein